MSNVLLKGVVLVLGASVLGLVFNQLRPSGGIELGRSVLEAKADELDRQREEALQAREETTPFFSLSGQPPPKDTGDEQPTPEPDAAEDTQVAPDGEALQSAELDFRVTIDQVRSLQETDSAFFLDARPMVYYEMGHIPGARLFPLPEYDQRIWDVAAELPSEAPIIVYCDGGDCSASLQVAQRLMDDGYLNVHVYEGGFPEWKAAGYPVNKGDLP